MAHAATAKPAGPGRQRSGRGTGTASAGKTAAGNAGAASRRATYADAEADRGRPGASVVGTSSIRRPASAALATISLANSMPGVTRPRRWMASPRKAPQATVKIADAGAEEQAPDEAEHRIAQITMQQGHGARRDAALEAIAHHQIGAGPQRCDDRLETGES